MWKTGNRTPQLCMRVVRGADIGGNGPQINPFQTRATTRHTYARTPATITPNPRAYVTLTTRVSSLRYTGAHVHRQQEHLQTYIHTSAYRDSQRDRRYTVCGCKYRSNQRTLNSKHACVSHGSTGLFSTFVGHRQADKDDANSEKSHKVVSDETIGGVGARSQKADVRVDPSARSLPNADINADISYKTCTANDAASSAADTIKHTSTDTETPTHNVTEADKRTTTGDEPNTENKADTDTDVHDGAEHFEPLPRDIANYELDRIAKVGGVVNVCLMVLKAGAGIVVGSAGLLASAADSCSDLVGDAVLLWALGAAKKPASTEHPWGHGRLETVASLGTGTLMLGAGLSVGWHSGMGLYENFLVEHGETISEHSHLLNSDWLPLGIGVALVSILSKEWLYRRTLKTAQSVGGSRVLEAHAHHHRSDALSAVAALCGLVGGMYGMGWADGVAGLLVSWLIAKQGGKICYESLSELADAGLDEGELKDMLVSVRSIQGVEDIIHERARRLGPFVEFHATILVDPWLSVSGARDLAEECRRIVMRQNTRVKFCLITTRPKRFAFEPCRHTGEGAQEMKDMGLDIDVGIEPGMQDFGLWGDDHNHSYLEEGQSHFSRRVMTEKLLRVTACSFPGITSVNRITLHRMHEDYKHIMTGYVVNITIDMADSDLMRCRQIALKLQKRLEKIELPDGSRPVKECDVHMDLTHIPSEILR